jgi:hypothetical protein
LNFWAERYLNYSTGLQREAPFASKDIDFQGSRDVVRLCADRLHGQPRFASMDDVTPNVAVVLFADSQGNERRIDFLDRPYGLDAKDAREMAIPVEFVRKKDRDERVEFLVLHCGYRSMSITDSGASRSLIPVEVDHCTHSQVIDRRRSPESCDFGAFAPEPVKALRASSATLRPYG